MDPRTVPPFAVDSAINHLQIRHNSHGSQNDQMFKDTFLMSHSDKWSEFLQNAGSNSAYTSRFKVGKHKLNEVKSRSIVASSSSSFDQEKDEKRLEVKEENEHGYKDNDSGTSYEDEIERVRKEVLQDLDGDWEGGKRLEAIFNAPIPDSYELSNQRDRNEWFKYIAQLKAFYYLKRESSEPGGAEHPYDNGIFQSMVVKSKNKINGKKNSWAVMERENKQQWIPRIRRLLLQSQYLPLSLRLTIGILCIVSLALATRIYQNSDSILPAMESSVPQQPSTIMALCVNSIAIIYLVYIGYDEFSGKPLGIRDPMAKVRLILLDLLFIIFSSANLSLTFNTLYDSRWVCVAGRGSETPQVGYICHKQKALASFLFLVLVTWVITFTISILRVVEKVSSGTQRVG